MPRAGSTYGRGYGPVHNHTRQSLVPVVASGRAVCARCGEPIGPGEPWDLGHSNDRQTFSGPEHRACNRRAGAETTNARRRRRRSRVW